MIHIEPCGHDTFMYLQ